MRQTFGVLLKVPKLEIGSCLVLHGLILWCLNLNKRYCCCCDELSRTQMYITTDADPGWLKPVLSADKLTGKLTLVPQKIDYVCSSYHKH